MGLFRRGKPLHERLAEEADLDVGTTGGDGVPQQRTPSRLSSLMHGLADGFLSAPPDEFGRPSPLGEVALHGVPRARQWDAVASVSSELPGDGVHFTALPDGTLLVEEELPDGALTPRADANEVTIAPPYRAEAVRRDDSLWAVGAKRIRVRELPGHEEDELELVEDGQVVSGRRLDGDLFEVVVTQL